MSLTSESCKKEGADASVTFCSRPQETHAYACRNAFVYVCLYGYVCVTGVLLSYTRAAMCTVVAVSAVCDFAASKYDVVRKKERKKIPLFCANGESFFLFLFLSSARNVALNFFLTLI